MLNWLQEKWIEISEFYGDSFVYNVKNMVGIRQRWTAHNRKNDFRWWEQASKAPLWKICSNCRTCLTNIERSSALL